ncbi:MAG: hypothetical protein M0Z82_06855 [Actinomycetota bacterium]|nr:hypothetical protein [Actinomycetota bacterium]
MIVRILGDHRYELAENSAELTQIEALDDQLGAALDAGDADAVTRILGELIAAVRSAGTEVPVDDFGSSDLVVPHEGSTLDEIRSLLASEA